MIQKLVEKSTNELSTFLNNVFTVLEGKISLTEVDIREGAHLVHVSRTKQDTNRG